MEDAPTPIIVKRRACVACTAVKAKCTPQTEQLCQRCARLGKQCVYLEVSSRKRKQRDTSRVEALEDKVNDLLETLATLKGQDGSRMSHNVAPRSSSHAGVIPDSASLPSSILPSAATPPLESSDGPEEVCSYDAIGRGLVSFEEAEAILVSFRDQFSTQFPFVVVSLEKSIQELRRDSPFLLHAMLAVGVYTNPQLQRQFGEEIRQQLGTRLVIGAEKSLDLLQGLLVYAAWYHYFLDRERPQIFLVVQLCINLVHELQLDKRRKAASLDEKRALLGVFYLSATITRTQRKPVLLNYSKQMEEYCQELAVLNYHPTDKLIQPLVSFQVLGNRVNQFFNYGDVTSASTQGEVAISFAVQSFLRELGGIKTSESSTSVCTILALSLNHLALASWSQEAVLHDDFWGTQSLGNNLASQRTAMLWQMVHTNNEFLCVFWSMPDRILACLGFSIFCELCHVFISQAKTTLVLIDRVENTGQDEFRSAVERIVAEVDYIATGTAIARKFEKMVQSAPGDQWDKDAMAQFTTLSKGLVSAYAKQVEQVLARGYSATATQLSPEIELHGQPVSKSMTEQEAPVAQEMVDGLRVEQGKSDAAMSFGNDGTVLFDEATWDLIMNNMMLPTY